MAVSARSRAAADSALAFFERFCVHTKGEWAGQPLKLEAWQANDIIRPLFGTLNRDGTRRYRTALIGIPRKNGKSTLGAGIALKLLFADGEPGAEIYSAASDREQAAIVFEMARSMVEASPQLASRAQVYRRSIVVPKTGNVYKVLSAEAFSKHGSSPHGVIFDELHAQPDRELWDVLTTGQGARRQPLTIAITTAGHDMSSVCYELYEYGRKVEARIAKDPTFFFRWWGLRTDDDWRDIEALKRANPNLGVSIYEKFLAAELNQAKQNPARENTFKRLYGNLWTSQHTRWLDLDAWDSNAALITEESLEGQVCYGAFDVSRTQDINALLLDFPQEDGSHKIVWRFFAPRDLLPTFDEQTAGMASVWAREGRLTLTEGDVVDYAAIATRILSDSARFDLRELAFNRRGASQLAQELEANGLDLVEMTTGLKLAPAVQEWERLLLGGKYQHGSHPVARFQFDGLSMKTDAEGNVWPDKGKSRSNISGMVAAVMALDRAVRHETSVYEERGLTVL